MKLDYGTTPPKRPRVSDAGVLLFQLLTAYFVISSITQPLMNALWIGELPVLALPQVPKVEIANSMRRHVVMPMLRACGWSLGSFSPDYSRARPYALALAYGIVLAVAVGTARFAGPTPSRRRRWMLIAAAAGLVDFAMTLWLAAGPGLSIY